MTLTDILFLIALIITLSTAVFLINSWNTPNLKDMVDKEVEKQQQEAFTGELTPHIKEAVTRLQHLQVESHGVQDLVFERLYSNVVEMFVFLPESYYGINALIFYTLGFGPFV